MEAIVNDTLQRPGGIPNALWDVIEKALQKDPNDRFRNALEMAQAMRDAVTPMKDHEVGALLSSRFPRRVSEVQAWEKTTNSSVKVMAAKD
jgi:serine/threonine-protein kinase